MPGSVSSVDSNFSAQHSEDSYDSDEEYALAQREWEESMEQLQQLVSIVVFPFLGRYLGRRWSFWLFSRYTQLGLGKAFFLGVPTLFAFGQT